MIHKIQKPIVTALGLAATVVFAVAGCGGEGNQAGEAVVVPDPSVSAPTTAAPAPTAAAPTATTASPTTATPSAPTKAEGWGTLKGQVVFAGNPPEPRVLAPQGKAAKDPNVCAKDAPIVSERLVVDASTKGVKNVFVYIPRPTRVNEEAKSAAAQATIEFDQKNCTFEPHALAVMAGSKIDLKSSDPMINHNIDAKLKANGTFNSLLAAGKAIPYTAAAAERMPCEVICDIHNWMRAYWLILDSPYFAVTDAKGNYEIKNVPAGTQKVVVWQEAVGPVTAASGDNVAIKADGTTPQDFKIDPGKVRPE